MQASASGVLRTILKAPATSCFEQNPKFCDNRWASRDIRTKALKHIYVLFKLWLYLDRSGVNTADITKTAVQSLLLLEQVNNLLFL